MNCAELGSALAMTCVPMRDDLFYMESAITPTMATLSAPMSKI